MAYGDTLGKIGASFFETGSQAGAFSNFMGNLYDLGDSYLQNSKDQEAADAANRLNAQVAKQQMEMAAQSAADERLLRQRILDRSAQLDKELMAQRAKLGDRVGVNAGDVYNNYQSFRSQIMDDYNDTVANISSQGFADAISRGMDRSTQQDYREAKLARTAAAELPKLDQAAFDQAIQRSQSYADTLNYGREASLKEVSDMYNTVINAEAKAMPTNAQGALANAAATSASFATSANNLAEDSQDYMGTALGNFNEKMAGNTGFALTGKGSFVDPTQSQQAKDLAAYEKAYGPLKGK
jgi:hypothetical protein